MIRNVLRIRSEAEIDAAFDWYFQRSPKAAAAFLAELNRSMRKVVSSPQTFPMFSRSTRRKILNRFPYSLIFREKGDVVTVFAVAHAKRRPGYWETRLKQ